MKSMYDLSQVEMPDYIHTRPNHLADMHFEDMDHAYSNAKWLKRSRQLQARRWQKIKSRGVE